MQVAHSPTDLKELYQARFEGKLEYRRRVWKELCDYFSRWIAPEHRVLELGCGYCEFINQVSAAEKYGMDLNPDASKFAAPDVAVVQQDCSQPWQLAGSSLDAVFTSNFFEHLPDKAALERTLTQAWSCLKPGGYLIAMGPNIRYVPGAYWDFYDHYIELTERSLAEVLRKCGFELGEVHAQFLPYTMSDSREYPIWMLRTYLKIPLAWKFFGKQFLVVAQKRLQQGFSGPHPALQDLT